MVVKQFLIILAALFLGVALSNTFDMPIPSNVLGFAILFFALCTGIIKLNQVEKISDFIIKYLALFFVVSIVGVMVHFQLIGQQFLQILVPLMVSIFIGFFVAAKVTELFINYEEKKKFAAKNNGLRGADHE